MRADVGTLRFLLSHLTKLPAADSARRDPPPPPSGHESRNVLIQSVNCLLGYMAVQLAEPYMQRRRLVKHARSSGAKTADKHGRHTEKR